MPSKLLPCCEEGRGILRMFVENGIHDTSTSLSNDKLSLTSGHSRLDCTGSKHSPNSSVFPYVRPNQANIYDAPFVSKLFYEPVFIHRTNIFTIFSLGISFAYHDLDISFPPAVVETLILIHC